MGEVYRESNKATKADNRRRVERFKLTVPARVTGYDRNGGKWHEMTETLDVSRTGLRLRLRRRVKHGTVLFVTLPLPTKLRGHGFSDQSYNVYTLVRRVEPPRQGVRAVGVEFLGEHPPKGYLDNPTAIFRSNRWGGSERRRPDREDRVESIRIEYFDETMKSIATEEATTENVSRTGLRISGTAAPTDFDVMPLAPSAPMMYRAESLRPAPPSDSAAIETDLSLTSMDRAATPSSSSAPAATARRASASSNSER